MSKASSQLQERRLCESSELARKSSYKQSAPSFNSLGLIPHKRLFGFVGGLVSRRIEKWEHGLRCCWRLGLLCASCRLPHLAAKSAARWGNRRFLDSLTLARNDKAFVMQTESRNRKQCPHQKPLVLPSGGCAATQSRNLRFPPTIAHKNRLLPYSGRGPAYSHLSLTEARANL